MNVIEAYGLTRYYRTQRGVRELDLAVPEGCVLGLLGENGCGKTTTIKLAVGALSQWLLKAIAANHAGPFRRLAFPVRIRTGMAPCPAAFPPASRVGSRKISI